MYCTNCGQKNDTNANFCSKCGEKFIAETKEINKAESQQSKDTGVRENQKDILAKEVMVFLRLVGISLVIAVVSIFIIYEMNSDNLSGLTYSSDRDIVIQANQRIQIKKNTPKVFFYSVIILTLGRYVIKGVTWADKRTKKNGSSESYNNH